MSDRMNRNNYEKLNFNHKDSPRNCKMTENRTVMG